MEFYHSNIKVTKTKLKMQKSIRNQGVIFKNISKTENQKYVTKEASRFSVKTELILTQLQKPWWELSTTTAWTIYTFSLNIHNTLMFQ